MFNHLAQFLKQLLADTAFSDRLIAGMGPQYRRSPSAANPRSKYREAFQGETDVCLVLASGKDRQVAYATECRAA